MVRVGTCAWSDHTGLYPAGLRPGERLAYYARFFPLVEVDSTFYHPLSARNASLWAERTPATFRFHVKAYRVLTWHERAMIPDAPQLRGEAEAFRRALQPLVQAGKLVTLHFQFPPWFVAAPEEQAYLEALRQALPDQPLSVEFRHVSWLQGEQAAATLALLRRLQMVYTVCDAPQVGTGTVPWVEAVTVPQLAIVRLHGRNVRTWYRKTASSGERFRYRYSLQELQGLVPALQRLQGQARDVHVLFNNNYEDAAVRNAAEMAALLGLGYADPWAGPGGP